MNQSLDFSTASTPREARARMFAGSVSAAYFPLDLAFKRPETFSGALSRRSLGAVGLSHLASTSVSYERRRAHLREAKEEEYLVTLPRLAPVEFWQMGREVRCAPGGILLERGDEPYRFRYDAPNELFVLKIARVSLAERMPRPDLACARAFDATTGSGALFVAMAVEAMRRADELAPAEAETVGLHLLDLLALALRGARGAPLAGGSAVRAAHLARIDACIRANLRRADLTPAVIAASCGLSTRYLHNLFRDSGTTVSRHVTDLRLFAARDRLRAEPSSSVAETAFRFGFADHAQFSRQFRARFGAAPSAFRRSVHEPAASPDGV